MIADATSLLITDNQELVVEKVGDVAQKTTTQLLIDTIAQKVANELVTNSALTTTLANYVTKAMMSNVQVNDQNKVPTSSLAFSMNQAITELNSDMSKIVFGTYTGKPEDGIIEIPAPGIQPNSAIAVNGDYAAANSTYVLGVRTPSDNNVLQVMVEGTSGTMRINYIYKKS